MNHAVYEAVAFAMRYWFIIALAVILVAVILISVKEYKARKQALSRVDAFLGFLEIVAGPEDLLGAKYGICSENLIGSGSHAEIWIDDESVNPMHANLFFEKGDVFLSSVGDSDTFVNGREIIGVYTLKTGDIVGVGDIDMRLHLKRKRVSA